MQNEKDIEELARILHKIDREQNENTTYKQQAEALMKEGYTKRPQDNNEFGHSGDKTVSSYPEDNQQPPKERKVSLEEIEEVLRSNGEIKHIPVSGDLVFGYLKPIAQAILSLINATEERKGAE